MELTIRKIVVLSLFFAMASPAIAENYPNRPITIYVPAAAGGPIDTLTRIMGEHMRQTLGQPIVIENVGGAAGSIGTDRVARAAPDGYTLITGIWNTHVANAAVYKLNYDVKDFVPIGLISYSGLLIVGRKDIPANNLQELIVWLKANPEKATLGTPGVGSIGQIGGYLFQKLTGTSVTHVPYRGLGPAMQDLVAGRIDLMFDTPATSLPQLKAGTIKAFAITADARLPAASDIPTAAEAGLPDMKIATWNAFFAPKGTPQDVVAKLNNAARKALADPTVQARLAEIGQQAYPADQQTPQALAKLQKEELSKWLPIIEEGGIRAQ